MTEQTIPWDDAKKLMYANGREVVECGDYKGQVTLRGDTNWSFDCNGYHHFHRVDGTCPGNDDRNIVLKPEPVVRYLHLRRKDGNNYVTITDKRCTLPDDIHRYRVEIDPGSGDVKFEKL